MLALRHISAASSNQCWWAKQVFDGPGDGICLFAAWYCKTNHESVSLMKCCRSSSIAWHAAACWAICVAVCVADCSLANIFVVWAVYQTLCLQFDECENIQQIMHHLSSLACLTQLCPTPLHLAMLSLSSATLLPWPATLCLYPGLLPWPAILACYPELLSWAADLCILLICLTQPRWAVMLIDGFPLFESMEKITVHPS